jgi:hypothetical protein
MAGARQQHHSTSRHVETPGQSQEDLHKFGERPILDLNNLETFPLPPDRHHWGEVLVDEDEDRGVILAHIISLNGPPEHLMRPLTCLAGEGARVE